MMERRCRLRLLIVTVAVTMPGVWPGVAARAEEAHLLAPALPRGITRVRATVRPFFSLIASGGGTVADFAVDHYFEAPFRLSLELAPLALALESGGAGAIGHVRAAGAYAGDFVEIGAAAGSRLQNYGAAGISLAGYLRLGALDGLNLTLVNGYVWKRNRYTGRPTIGFGSLTGTVDVPLSRRFLLFTEGAFSTDHWLYWTAGLRHRIGDGQAGTWVISGAFGLGWVVDRPDCAYPETGWCTGSAWAAGPTFAFGLERRF